MEQFFISNEGAIRLAAFAGLLTLFILAEALWPRRDRALGRFQRWTTNGLMTILNTVALRVAVPVLAVGAAGFAQRMDVGLLNMLDVAQWVTVLAAIILLDAAIYAQHLVFHHVPVLWRIHRVHHVDRDIDVTTALRFHPVEILLSMVIKIALVVALGAPPAAVIIFEVLLNGTAMFNHANLRLPLGFDRALRWLIVTPDMHRVHHSVRVPETNSNFGFNLSLWDRLFGTYKDQPDDGHTSMTIGLSEFQDDRPARLGFSLWLPFSKGP
ncbi:sterol desaturase family protein [Pyruvatibacter sp. HU-CL02332]|uniref:sterol desaturase family protein n=1 Tax=Pyruvatibacter sp. HU-CL02332 TaxID=3127650 RepID=UPI0031088080